MKAVLVVRSRGHVLGYPLRMCSWAHMSLLRLHHLSDAGNLHGRKQFDCLKWENWYVQLLRRGGIQFLDRMLLLARYSKQCIKVKAQNNGYCDKSQVPQDKIALSTKVINLDWKKGFSELESVLYKNATWDLCWAEERGRCISMLKHTAFIYKIHNWYDLS